MGKLNFIIRHIRHLVQTRQLLDGFYFCARFCTCALGTLSVPFIANWFLIFGVPSSMDFLLLCLRRRTTKMIRKLFMSGIGTLTPCDWFDVVLFYFLSFRGCNRSWGDVMTSKRRLLVVFYITVWYTGFLRIFLSLMCCVLLSLALWVFCFRWCQVFAVWSEIPSHCSFKRFIYNHDRAYKNFHDCVSLSVNVSLSLFIMQSWWGLYLLVDVKCQPFLSESHCAQEEALLGSSIFCVKLWESWSLWHGTVDKNHSGISAAVKNTFPRLLFEYTADICHSEIIRKRSF